MIPEFESSLTAHQSRDQWVRTFDTNIHPYFYLAKYALQHLKRGDTIVNCASINAYSGHPSLLDYTSTKGAIIAFTRALSNQQIGNGIRVNAVAPGPGKLTWLHLALKPYHTNFCSVDSFDPVNNG